MKKQLCPKGLFDAKGLWLYYAQLSFSDTIRDACTYSRYCVLQTCIMLTEMLTAYRNKPQYNQSIVRHINIMGVNTMALWDSRPSI